MIIMLTYRCSLDCDHCMLYDTGPAGRHMSREVFAAAMRLRHTIGSNQLGIAGGEAVEHPAFWPILTAVREQESPKVSRLRWRRAASRLKKIPN